jgi:signal transduction histidine kinase
MRIAEDIHDDMGASLTRISLISTHALRHTTPGSPIHGELKRMDLAAREVAITLDEIVWAVNPAHDTLDGLSNYISQYVTEIVAHSERRCRLEIPALLPARFISSGVRHHLLMALKEALNNSLKHSGALEVGVQLVFTDPKLVIVIADNGGGFDPESAASGNGIANMNRRLQAAGGACHIQSAVGQGTVVTFTVELQPEAPF